MSTDQGNGPIDQARGEQTDQIFEMLQSVTQQMSSMRTENQNRFEALELRTPERPSPVRHDRVEETVSIRPPNFSSANVDEALIKATAADDVRSSETDMPILTDDNYPEWAYQALISVHCAVGCCSTSAEQ